MGESRVFETFVILMLVQYIVLMMVIVAMLYSTVDVFSFVFGILIGSSIPTVSIVIFYTVERIKTTIPSPFKSN